MVKRISESEFEQVRKEEVAVIDFSAAWCVPCNMLAPVMEEVSEELGGKAAFYNVDVDENPRLRDEFSIMNIPALVILKKGEKAGQQIGFMPKEGIMKFIEDTM